MERSAIFQADDGRKLPGTATDEHPSAPGAVVFLVEGQNQVLRPGDVSGELGLIADRSGASDDAAVRMRDAAIRGGWRAVVTVLTFHRQ